MSESFRAVVPNSHDFKPHYAYAVHPNTSIKQFQDFVFKVYGLSNDRNYDLWDMVSNIERFTMRGLKGIRKGNVEKAKTNLRIALSWFASLMNRLRIDLETNVWRRFPGCCSYCGHCPCSCKKDKTTQRVEVREALIVQPKTLDEYQKMFDSIYPAEARTLEHAGVHLAEEMGELSEAIMTYRGGHDHNAFNEIEDEAADFFSCMMGVFNSLKVNVAHELAETFTHNCHVCHAAPCTCTFEFVSKFKS
jgi:NTP pyrophosphatase (non-canonical NTP hydrolase)